MSTGWRPADEIRSRIRSVVLDDETVLIRISGSKVDVRAEKSWEGRWLTDDEARIVVTAVYEAFTTDGLEET